MENIIRFFHNIIPGSYFLYFLSYLLKNNRPNFIFDHPLTQLINSNNSSVPFALMFVIASLFIGFISQAFIKFIKDNYLYDIVFCRIIQKDNFSYQQAKHLLINNKLISPDEEDTKKIFFLMNDFLAANQKNYLIDNFWFGNAFWGNISASSLVLILFAYLINFPDQSLKLAFVFLFVVSGAIFFKHLCTMHDIILKTYVSILRFDYRKSGILLKK